MAINPQTGLEEVDPITGLPVVSAPAAPAPVPAAPAAPDVKKYIMEKYGLGDKLSDEARQKLVDESAAKASGPDWLAGIASFGASLQGKDGGAAAKAILDKQKADRDRPIAEFDKARAQKIQDFELGRNATKAEREDRDDAQKQDLFKRENDPNSQESMVSKRLYEKMSGKPAPENMTANQFKNFSPAMTKMYEIEQKKLDRQEARDERRFQAGLKMEEKAQKLQTPYGLANTEDDAKKLKEAHESKKSFDSKIQEMIDLRKKYGGEAFNREAVARGKQLSKDLLLEYKNMAKLGVLSAADEKIINAIIPDDPLEFQMASLVGQDPILKNLESFQRDSDKDFQTRVQTRTREGLKNTKPEDLATSKAPKAANEVERKTKDGRIGIFDADTKEFLRYK